MGYNSKQVLIDKMRELVTKGKFDKISVDMLTKECNLTRGSFYYHFQNKYDILEKMFILDVGEFHAQSDSAFFNSMRNILVAMTQHREYYVQAFKIFDFRAYLYRYFETNVGMWMRPKAGVSFEDTQQLFVTRLVAYGWTAFICKWGHEGFRESPDELVRLFTEFPSYPLWDVDLLTHEE